MAKLRGPLFSLGASQQLGKALVFFPWKGLNVVREYVVPSNPKTTGQTTQRGYLTLAVALVHGLQAWSAHMMTSTDVSAYALWGSTFATPRTWFNQAVKNYIDQKVASKTGMIYCAGVTTPGASKLDVIIYGQSDPASAGNFKYGTSKTALIHSKAATAATPQYNASITGLTTGVKYFWQFVPTAPAGSVGCKSGIYYGTPT